MDVVRRARVSRSRSDTKMPWVVIFTPPIGFWERHAFYEWSDALRFALDLTDPDESKSKRWIDQLITSDPFTISDWRKSIGLKETI